MTESRRWLAGCLFLPLIFGGIAILLMVTAVSSIDGQHSMDEIFEQSVDESPNAMGKIVLIPVRGVITSDGKNGGVTDYVMKALLKARRDENVRTVVLEIDSPGGGITDADQIHHEVLKVKQAGKKVVAFFGNIAASGGYYIAVAANEIWSQPTSITGSIGVIVPAYSAEALLQKIGVVDQSVSSGDNKQILNPSKTMTAEQRALIQSVVDAMYHRFVDLVAKGRGLTEEAVLPLADGRLFSAQQALEASLIDKIGYSDELIAELRKSETQALSVYRYQSPISFMELLMGGRINALLSRLDAAFVSSYGLPNYLLSW